MVTNNALNITATGLVKYDGAGAFTATTTTNHAVLIGAASNAITNVGPIAATGAILQSNGATSDPGFSTATYPSIATGTGTLLRADGTNWVATTSTYPNTNAVSTLLYASSANVMAALTTANNGMLVTSATGVPSILAGPGTTGNILQSNAAAAPSFSTATFPSTATGTGTLLRADGTNWVATTSTYPNTNAVSTLLYASSSNVMAALATANNSIVLTNATGVPSLGTTLANSFSFAASSSGAVVSTTVSNTSNTSSSDALQQVTVAGTSAGDAFTTYTVSGTTNWSVGTDNSVTGDPFVIAASTALGTANIMSALTSGEINYPLQPAFFATAAAQSNVTGDGTTYTVQYTNEIFDQNGDFDGTSTFTAPVTGRYLVCQNCQGNTLGALHTLGNVKITASNRSITTDSVSWGIIRNSNNATALSSSTLIDMDSADTCTIVFTVSNSTKTVNVTVDQTTFSMNLVC